MSGNLIIDTSIWISYFQTKSSNKLTAQVDDLISTGSIHVPKIVLAELIQGAHSEKEIAVIQDFFEAFHVIGEKEGSWLEAGRLSYALKKKGKTVNLADCYIAVLAAENDCSILTLDRHFKEIQKERRITLITVHT